MKKNNKCKRCGEKGWYYDSYAAGDLDATKLCPDCQPEAQTEQKESECHCHHHGNCVEDAACIAMYCEHCHPQPTDGLVNYAPILDAGQAGFTGIHADRYWLVRENCIRKLLTEQKQKTREDTIDRCIQTIEHAANNLVKYRRKEGKPYVLASAGLLKTLKHNIYESKIT